MAQDPYANYMDRDRISEILREGGIQALNAYLQCRPRTIPIRRARPMLPSRHPQLPDPQPEGLLLLGLAVVVWLVWFCL